ncbi:hypothetical protein Dip510_000072 [Elusimicrobium posterum]|uniref:hypothetical protein n=1 Tax=Elusimicrobium posterum TaxID=3116653 RepID=UPI003C78866D
MQKELITPELITFILGLTALGGIFYKPAKTLFSGEAKLNSKIKKVSLEEFANSKELKNVQADISILKKERDMQSMELAHHKEMYNKDMQQLKGDLAEIKQDQKERFAEIKELIKGRIL